MSFHRYPKKQQKIKCDYANLVMLLANQIIEFVKVEYLQNQPRDEIDFFYAQISKGATN